MCTHPAFRWSCVQCTHAACSCLQTLPYTVLPTMFPMHTHPMFQILPYLVLFVYFGSLARDMADIFAGKAGLNPSATVAMGALSAVLLVAIVWYTTHFSRQAHAAAYAACLRAVGAGCAVGGGHTYTPTHTNMHTRKPAHRHALTHKMLAVRAERRLAARWRLMRMSCRPKSRTTATSCRC